MVKGSQIASEIQSTTVSSDLGTNISCCDVPREADSARRTLHFEVRTLAGEVLLQDTFLLDDRIEVVKRKLLKQHGYPLFRQELVWEENVLQPGSFLKDVGSLIDGNILQLVLKSLPDASEMEDSQKYKVAALAVIESWHDAPRNRMLQELSCFQRPPPACEAVSLAVLHLLARVECSVKVSKFGIASDATWKAAQAMFKSATFVQSLRRLPTVIDKGKLNACSLDQARRQLGNVEGDDTPAKIQRVRSQSLAAELLITWALNIMTYAEAVSRISESWYEASMGDLFPSLDSVDV